MKEIFFEVFFSLVRLFLSTNDEFLRQKLVKKTKEFFNTYNNVKNVAKPGDIAQDDNNVAQYRHQDFLKSIDNLQELIEIMVHLKLVDPSPALLAQKNLLRLKSKIIDSILPKPKVTKGEKLIYNRGETLHVDKLPVAQRGRYLKEKVLDYL